MITELCEKRRKIRCPICGKMVLYLAKHLRSKQHAWSKVASRTGYVTLGLHEHRHLSLKKLRPCDHPGCKAKVANLSQHKRKIHAKDNAARQSQLRNNILQGYAQWARSPDGGAKSTQTVYNYTGNMKLIFANDGIRSLADIVTHNKVLGYFQERTGCAPPAEKSTQNKVSMKNTNKK